MLIGFRAAHHEPATEEFLVVQFLHGAFRFLDGLHLHKRKTFRALVVPIAYDLCVMHVANAVEQVEEIALGGVERQVANVETRRRDFNPFWLARRSRWLRAIARLCRLLSFSRRRFRKIRQPAAKTSFSASSPVPVVLESVPDFLCVGPHRAGGVGVFRMNKSSC